MPRIKDLHDREHRQLEASVSEKTVEFLKWVHSTMKSKGFTRTHARNLSAMFDWRYENGQRVICLDGWHGTGKRGTCRHFGDLKLCFGLYDNQPGGSKSPRALYPEERMKLDLDADTVFIDKFYREVRAHIEGL